MNRRDKPFEGPRLLEPAVTEALAVFIAELRRRPIPTDALNKARDCLLDSVGCMLGGTLVYEVRQIVELVTAPGRTVDIMVLFIIVPGWPGTYTAPLAAYAATQLANALDFDDTVFDLGHVGVAVVGVALALGQAYRSSGPQVLRAPVAGYEVAIRVGQAMAPTMERGRVVRGHPGIIFGTTASSAVLLDLDPARVEDAFGLAARHAVVPFVGQWYDERPIWPLKNNYGWVALRGLPAAQMASRGVRCNRRIFDGPGGFWAMAGSDRRNHSLVVDGLGERFAVSAVEFKPFPACRYSHTALDATRKLVIEYGLRPERVNRILVQIPPGGQVFADYRPSTFIDAQFSLPYMVGACF